MDRNMLVRLQSFVHPAAQAHIYGPRNLNEMIAHLLLVDTCRIQGMHK